MFDLESSICYKYKSVLEFSNVIIIIVHFISKIIVQYYVVVWSIDDMYLFLIFICMKFLDKFTLIVITIASSFAMNFVTFQQQDMRFLAAVDRKIQLLFSDKVDRKMI